MATWGTIVDPLGLWPRAARMGGRAGAAAADGAATAAIRLLDQALASPRSEEALEVVLRSALVKRVTERVLAGPEIDRLVAAALESPVLERLVAGVLDSPGTERLVAQVLDSHLADASVARALAGEQLWVVVEEIAQSPAVTQAITQQSAGFANQVAGEVGERSRRADAWLERRARRILRRPASQDVAAAEPGPS